MKSLACVAPRSLHVHTPRRICHHLAHLRGGRLAHSLSLVPETAHSNSASANQRHSNFGSTGSNRNSTYDPTRRSSFYASGNRGAPHSAHARERVGLVMPQPLAPEVSNYARQDIGSRSNLGTGSEQDHTLAPPRVARPDSWVVSAHSSLPNLNDSPTSDAPSQKNGTLPRGRDRTARAETSQS